MEKIINWICRIIMLLGFVYGLMFNNMSITEKLYTLLFIVTGILVGYVGYRRGYNDAKKEINGDISRKDPRNEDT